MIPAPLHLAVRAPNWVGDLVMATPVLRAALRAEGIAAVSVLLPEKLAPLFAEDPLEAHLRPVPGGAREERLLRDLRPDAVLLLSSSLGAAWRAFRAGVPLRAGAALSGRRPLLTHAVVPAARGGRRFPVPTAHLLRDVAGLVGIAVQDLHPALAFGAGVAARARELLAAAGVGEGEDYVLCAPGAAFGAAKLWPPARFAAALDELHARRGWRAVVTGGPGEEALMDEVARLARSPVASLAGLPRDLAVSKPLAAWSRLVLVGDSGPRWLAAAFDVPCVSVMGPNFPELTATSLELCEVVRRDDLECAPCLRRRCPLGHHRCLDELPVAAVIAAAERVLARPRPAAPQGRCGPARTSVA